MSYQAYIDTIFNKTGKTPEEFAALANEKKLFAPGTKAGKIIDWLNAEYNLGQGHSMALYGLFKHMGLVALVEKTKKVKISKPYVSKPKPKK